MDSFDIETDAYLFKIHSYRLQLPDWIVHIDVYEVMQGTTEATFIAVPMDHPSMKRRALESFYGQGKTQNDALNECLKRIRGVAKDLIFD